MGDMKISYQQLFIMILCIAQPISAITLCNTSNSTIRFNIFKKKLIQHGYKFDPFSKGSGKISPHASYQINNLDPNDDYTVTFYDVYNCKNNKVFTVKGNKRKLLFRIDDESLAIA